MITDRPTEAPTPSQARAIRALKIQESSAADRPGAYSPGLVRGCGFSGFTVRSLRALVRKGYAVREGSLFQLTDAGRKLIVFPHLRDTGSPVRFRA